MAMEEKQGRVYLVGSGPGTADLITLRGMRLLKNADAVVYDYLADPQLLREAPDGCELIYVGKKAGQHTRRQEELTAVGERTRWPCRRRGYRLRGYRG